MHSLAIRELLPLLFVTLLGLAACGTPSALSLQRAQPSATPTVPPQPTATPVFNVDPVAKMKSAQPLLVQPGGSAGETKDPIPVNDEVTLLRQDESGKWFRVMWAEQIGWVPAAATTFVGHLPVLRAPPLCARPIGITTSLDKGYTYKGSPGQIQLVLVIDLRRTKLGAFPASTFQVLVNGTPDPRKVRHVTTRGEFLLLGSAVGINVSKPGDQITFQLAPSASEPLNLYVAVFQVPVNCTFGEV